MRAICVCMDQFESRTLLSAGIPDLSYASPYEGWSMPVGGAEVHAQLDGKMLHYAHLGTYTDSTQIWRSNSNGTLDTTFGSGGVISLGSAPISEYSVGADGKIVVLMENYGTTLELRRYNANGTLDTSFASGGKLTVTVPQNSYYNDMAIQTDGKIIVVGQDDINGYIRRFNANGSVDTSFASGGVKTITPQYPMGFGWVNMGTVDIRRSDNRIVVTYNQNVHGGGETAELWVLAPNGGVEWQYEGAPMPSDGSTAGRVIVDGDGSILVSGSALFYDSNGDYAYHDYLVRHPAPKSTTPTMWISRPDDLVGPIYPQVDGRLLTIVSDMRVQRLNYNLTLDTYFGSGGTVYFTYFPSSLAVQGDGKIVVDGSVQLSPKDPEEDYHSARLTGDSPAATLGADGTLNLSGSSRNDFIRASTTGGIVGIQNNAAGPFPFTASTVKKIVANAGDGNDTVLLSGALPASILNGGNGNDTLTGADGADTLNPGLGNDILKGGNNRDTVTYAGRPSGLVLSIDNSANDGQTGEFDNISTDIETVIGGNGNDRITGSDATNALYGGGGNDQLTGSAGADSLFGDDGDDTLFARDGVADLLLNGGNGFDSAQIDSSDANKTGIEKYLA